MRDQLSSRAFAGWVAYASVEPFGEERADLRAGIVASVIANVNRDRKKRPEPFTPQDFMARFGEDPSAPTPADDLSAKLKAAFSQFKAEKKTPPKALVKKGKR